MGEIVKIDERGRITIPSKYRNKTKTSYFKLHEEEGCIVLTPVPDPLKNLTGRITRKKPIKELDEAPKEEAEHIIKKEGNFH